MDINRLKEIREDRDYLQSDIADILGMKQPHYSRYEQGIRALPIEKYDLLADFYNVSIDYLVSRTDEKKPYPKSKIN